MRYKYRIKFIKYGRMRFIGHLDLANVFRRVLNRAKIPMAYSQGFNPHQEISFALPLSLGYYSNGEYMDIICVNPIDTKAVCESLNTFMPEGVNVLVTKEFNQGEKSSAALVKAASYSISIPDDLVLTNELISTFMAQNTIEILKKSKNNEQITDIKPDIINISIDDNNILKVTLSAGPESSLRADALVKALYDFNTVELNPLKVKYVREDLLKEENGKLVPIIG
jgi:radical SAM-linked protein